MDPVVHWILRAGLAALMASAVFHKASDPAAFVGTLRDYRLLPGRLVPLAASAIVASELGIGIALLVPGLAVPAALACAALLLLYSGAIGINLARGRRHIDCGCLGPGARQPIHGWLLVRNGALIAICLVATVPATGRAITWIDAVSILGGLSVVALLFQALPALVGAEISSRRSA
jgi:hypothetical protein